MKCTRRHFWCPWNKEVLLMSTLHSKQTTSCCILFVLRNLSWRMILSIPLHKILSSLLYRIRFYCCHSHILSCQHLFTSQAIMSFYSQSSGPCPSRMIDMAAVRNQVCLPCVMLESYYPLSPRFDSCKTLRNGAKEEAAAERHWRCEERSGRFN